MGTRVGPSSLPGAGGSPGSPRGLRGHCRVPRGVIPPCWRSWGACSGLMMLEVQAACRVAGAGRGGCLQVPQRAGRLSCHLAGVCGTCPSQPRPALCATVLLRLRLLTPVQRVQRSLAGLPFPPRPVCFLCAGRGFVLFGRRKREAPVRFSLSHLTSPLLDMGTPNCFLLRAQHLSPDPTHAVTKVCRDLAPPAVLSADTCGLQFSSVLAGLVCCSDSWDSGKYVTCIYLFIRKGGDDIHWRGCAGRGGWGGVQRSSPPWVHPLQEPPGLQQPRSPRSLCFGFYGGFMTWA